MKYILIIFFIAIIALTNGFTLSPSIRSSSLSMKFDFDKAVSTLSRNKILTKTSQLGLLSKLEKAGFKLTTAVPLLIKADELDVLGVLESSSDKVLPLLATVIDTAPALLPVAATALKIPSEVLLLSAILSLGGAVGEIVLLPDDSLVNIALQTFLFVPLGIILPGAFGVGSVVLSKLK